MRRFSRLTALLWCAALSLAACDPPVPAPAQHRRPPPDAGDAPAAPENPVAWDGGHTPPAVDDRPPNRTPDRTSADAGIRPADASDGPRPDAGVTPDSRDARADGPVDADADANADANAEVALDRVDVGGPSARVPRPGEVVIDEILFDPAGTDLGREWFEVVNVTTEPLDLTALHVADDVTDVAVDAGVLAAGAVLVLGQSADPAHNGGAPVQRAYGTRLLLNNGADRIAICVGPCADGPPVDQVAWDGTLGTAYEGHAMVIIPGRAGVCPATESFGTGGSFGSPGKADVTCPVQRPDGGPDGS